MSAMRVLPEGWVERNCGGAPLLAARAGYDPRAGVTLWQKMGAASKGAPPQFLSTHPSGKTRIADIERNLPKVMPLYEASQKR